MRIWDSCFTSRTWLFYTGEFGKNYRLRSGQDTRWAVGNGVIVVVLFLGALATWRKPAWGPSRIGCSGGGGGLVGRGRMWSWTLHRLISKKASWARSSWEGARSEKWKNRAWTQAQQTGFGPPRSRDQEYKEFGLDSPSFKTREGPRAILSALTDFQSEKYIMFLKEVQEAGSRG